MKSLSHRHRKVILVLVGILLVIAVAIAGWMTFFNDEQTTTTSREKQELKRITAEEEPKEDAAKVTHYAQLADAHAESGNSKAALEAMLKADTFIKDRSIGTGNTVNIGIAQLYAKTGNKQKAKEYYQREIDRRDGSDNAESIEYIKKLMSEL